MNLRWTLPTILLTLLVFPMRDSSDPSLYYTTTQFLQASGYPSSRYDVKTEDGYILSLFRIAENTTRISNRPPVLIMHGMSVSSDSWLLQEPRKNLAYMLYDAGYDVWLGDNRGNFYSRRHVSLSPSDPRFWQFSFHEMGMYDLPATIDKILKTTGNDQISYIGHSMGTTTFSVMASEVPDSMTKIRVFIGLAPAWIMRRENISHEKSVIINFLNDLLSNFEKKGTFELFPRVAFAPQLASIFCKEGSLTQDLCYDLIFFWAGNQAKRISRKTLPRVLSHVPAGFSLNTALHFIKGLRSGQFRRYDFSPQENRLRYGSLEPPEYNISRVTCPVAIHYSAGDFLINSTDVQMNMKLMPNVFFSKEFVDLNHIDFSWGRTAWREVYPDVISNLNKFNNLLK